VRRVNRERKAVRVPAVKRELEVSQELRAKPVRWVRQARPVRLVERVQPESRAFKV
jgi:hypothetical protein